MASFSRAANGRGAVTQVANWLARGWFAGRFCLLAFRLPRPMLRYVETTAYRLGANHPRRCPICGHHGDFTAAGDPPRYDARCPGCGSFERQRLLYLRLIAPGIITAHASLLHFAPEPLVRRQLAASISHYRTADLVAEGVDLALNIEQLDLPDACFEAVLCSHVLEHVDDKRALAGLHRILAPGGVLYCMIPIVEGWDVTYEAANVDGARARELHFGQRDHVRYYGRDFRDRVQAAGFALEELTCSGEEAVDHGLTRGERIFVCRKP